MKLITYDSAGELHCGIVLGSRVLALAAAPLQAVLSSLEQMDLARKLEERALADAARSPP